MDIYLVELDKALASGLTDNETLPAPLLPLLSPFLELVSRTNSNVAYQRISNEIFHPLLIAFKPQPELDPDNPRKKRPRPDDGPTFSHILGNSCLEDPKEEGKIERVQLRKGLLRKVFDIASGPDARESNRRKMHAVWKSAMTEYDGGVVDG